MSLRTRFAPSPTGLLHLGNARTALFTWLLARSRGGAFLLRLEDTDAARVDPAAEAALLEDLRWLGLDWEEGPDVGGPRGPYRQSGRQALHEAQLSRLRERGLAYPCFCTEAELARARAGQRARGLPPRYPGTCAGLDPEEAARRLARGEPAAWRLRLPREGEVAFEDLVRGPQRFRCAELGDFVLRRPDGRFTFLFANAVDDALMGITHVLRGEDHLSNTPRQLLLLEALELEPPRYGHLPLLLGPDGAPLSKRRGARPLRAWRREGYLPQALRNHLARLGHHYAPEGLLDTGALARGFALERVGRAPARHDEGRLRRWQRLAVDALPGEALERWLDGALEGVPAGRRRAFAEAVRPNVLLPAEAAAWARRLYGPPPPLAGEALEAAREAGEAFYRTAREALEVASQQGEGWPRAFLEALAGATGRRGGRLYRPLRAALTGGLQGPAVPELLGLLGPEEVARRLDRTRQALAGSALGPGGGGG